MKYKILLFFVFLNINLILFGQKRLYDNILNKVETNIDKNYFTDSILAVRHSEYIVNEITKEFKKAVCIDYFPTPMWVIDGDYYNKRYGYNNSVFPIRLIGYLITSKLYKKNELSNLGFTFPHRFASPYSRIDIDDFNSSLHKFVRFNRNKREDLKKVSNDINLPNIINMPSFDIDDKIGNQKPTISIEYGNTNNERTSKNNSVSVNNIPKAISITTTPIYTKVADSTVYIVDNVVHYGVDCYKLTKIIKTRFSYKEFERQRFENRLYNDYSNISEQKKNEYRQLVEYWANGETVFSESYIVSKKNYAILLFLHELKQQNNKGEWIGIEKITEKYQEGKNKKYYQTSYTKLIRNYNGGFPNIDNLITLMVRTPTNRVFSLESTTIIPRKPYLTYEDFCEKVDTLDDYMLMDWNKYNE